MRNAGGLEARAIIAEASISARKSGALHRNPMAGGDRGLPLVAFRTRRGASGAADPGPGSDHCGGARFRAILFPEDGSDDCGCGVRSETASINKETLLVCRMFFF
jgi:hypothetical protein